jgi:hypothetical protein
LLEEIRNLPSLYVEGAFEPSFCQSRFRPFVKRQTDISMFKRMINGARLTEPV